MVIQGQEEVTAAFPTEIQDAILAEAGKNEADQAKAPSQLRDLTTILQLTLTSKHFYQRTNWLLWRHIRVATPTRLARLHDALQRQPANRTFVKSFHLGELDDLDQEEANAALVLAAATLRLLVSLQNLSLAGCFTRLSNHRKLDSPSLKFLCVEPGRLPGDEAYVGGDGQFHDENEETAHDDEGCFSIHGNKLPALESLRICGAFDSSCVVNTLGDMFGLHDRNLPSLKQTTWDMGTSLYPLLDSVTALCRLVDEVSRSDVSNARQGVALLRPHHSVNILIERSDLIRIKKLDPRIARHLAQLANPGAVSRRHSANIVELVRHTDVTVEEVLAEFAERNHEWWAQRALELD